MADTVTLPHAFEGTAEIAYNGFTAETTAKSDWQSGRELTRIKALFDVCASV